MPKLVWGQIEQIRYEAGVDQGVLYPSDGPGVVWNGLISVEETSIGGESSPYYFDGTKYLDIISPKNYQAILTAFSAPEEFGSYIGERSIIPGFVLTRQPRLQFNLSYRTLLGNNLGYKIHLIYNALASPNNVGYTSINPSSNVKPFSWKIDAVPPARSTYRPSAHFVLDSTKTHPDALKIVEIILYGTTKEDARFPNVEELLDIIAIWAPVIIIPEEIGGLAQLSFGIGDLYRSKIDGILRTLPTTRLYKHSTVDGLYRME